jgi:hypothetical protein
MQQYDGGTAAAPGGRANMQGRGVRGGLHLPPVLPITIENAVVSQCQKE